MGIEEDLQSDKISYLDLSHGIIVSSGTQEVEALEVMRQKRVGTLLVLKSDKVLAGIFTERDVLLKIADKPSTWNRPIDEFMTAEPLTLAAHKVVSHALQLMNNGHFRNIPVVDKGAIKGNISQHALIHFLSDRFPIGVYNLPPDLDKFPMTKEGA